MAQHIRNSSNLSKDHLLKLPDTKIETKQDLVISSNGSEATNEAAGRQDALCVLEVGSPEEPLRISPVTQYDTSTVVYNILNCVTSIGADSPDRLRGLEIAEVCHILHLRSLIFRELVLTTLVNSLSYMRSNAPGRRK